MKRASLALGIDLGGTKILAALIDKQGKIYDSEEVPSQVEPGEQIIRDRVIPLMQTIWERNARVRPSICGIGIATAGLVDTKTKTIKVAYNLGLKDAAIGHLLEQRFRLPVHIGNDANVAAIGEWMWGAGKGYRDVIYITVSTGIGCGIISGGRLVTGVGDSAGEFGHISIAWDGPKCACGNYGCLENYASGTAIARQARQIIREGEATKLAYGNVEALTAKEVAEAAIDGDGPAIRILQQAGKYIGAGVTNLIHLFDTEIIIFGGGVMKASQILLPVISETVQDRCIPAMKERVRLVSAMLGSEAGVKGAAGLVFSNGV